MRKRLKTIAVVLAAFLAVLLEPGGTAWAKEGLDLSRRGEITVAMQDPETYAPIPGGTITLYRAGDLVRDEKGYHFEPAGAFAGSGEALEVLDGELARRLSNYAEKEQLSGETKEIGKDGTASYTDLTPGLYLLVQNQAPKGWQSVKPFLASVPLEEDGAYRYQVDALPKMEPMKKTPPSSKDRPGGSGSTEAPGTPSPIGAPRTGDTAPLGLWLAVAGMSALGLWGLSRYERHI